MKKMLLLLLFLAASCGQDAKIVQGPPGNPAPISPYDIVGEIIPCGRVYPDDEILLVERNGEIIVSLNVKGKASLVATPPGNYVTTDKKSCAFTVNADNTVSW